MREKAVAAKRKILLRVSASPRLRLRPHPTIHALVPVSRPPTNSQSPVDIYIRVGYIRCRYICRTALKPRKICFP